MFKQETENYFFTNSIKKTLWNLNLNMYWHVNKKFKGRETYNVDTMYMYRNFNFVFLYFKKIIFMSFYYNFHINYMYSLNFLISKVRNKLFIYFFTTKSINFMNIYFKILKKNKKYIYFIDKFVHGHIISLCIKWKIVFNYFFFFNHNLYIYFINLSILKFKINFYKKNFLIFGQI